MATVAPWECTDMHTVVPAMQAYFGSISLNQIRTLPCPPDRNLEEEFCSLKYLDGTLLKVKPNSNHYAFQNSSFHIFNYFISYVHVLGAHDNLTPKEVSSQFIMEVCRLSWTELVIDHGPYPR